MNLNDIKLLEGVDKMPVWLKPSRDCLLDYRLFETLGGIKDAPNYEYDFDIPLKWGCNLQRDYVWEHCQQEEFIKNILLEKPIPSIVVIQESYKNRDIRKNLVIDGKQRLLTIKKFINNEFEVCGCKWDDFDSDLKQWFRNRVNYLTAWIYYSYPDTEQFITDELKIILFNYFNFSGTPQTQEHKNKLISLLND